MEEKVNTETIVMYGHPACPAVIPVKSMLNQANVQYHYINIFEDNEARQRVLDINDGYQSVPTLVFPDGTTLTEPSTGELSDKLISLGYNVPITAKLVGNMWLILMAAAIVFALLRGFGLI